MRAERGKHTGKHWKHMGSIGSIGSTGRARSTFLGTVLNFFEVPWSVLSVFCS